MSGALTAVLTGLQLAASWRNNLRASSFRGVPFYVDEANGFGGRRLAVHEYPLRNAPSVEDLGKSANRYLIRAWVIGDNYLQNSYDLINALQDNDTAGVFVHPWRGEITCRAGLLSWHESKNDGGFCGFDIEFIVDNGGLPSPTLTVDTASALLARIASMLSLAVAAYETASLIAAHPADLLTFAGTLLGNASGSLLGLPTAVIGGLAQAALDVAQTPSSDSSTATAVQTVFQAAAANAVTAATPVITPDDPVLGLSPLLAPAADPSGGLAALTTWGDTLAVPADPNQAAQQLAIQQLVQGQAVLAVLTVYAQIAWPSSNAAAAARDQVQTMIDAQLNLAAETGADDLYRGWLAVSGAAMQDLITRAQALPSLITYTTLASQSSLVLAWGWYQDAGRADEIDMLNDVPDPMFMPYSGVRLSA